MIVKGITIHNTNNEYSAKKNYELLLKNQKTNLCHYLIDDEEIINTLSEDVEAMHTGKGYDNGNKYTIAIEICKSRCDEEAYLKAEKKAIKFIKKLMKKYNLTKEDIYFHNDFNKQMYCPHRILDIYKKKEVFINGSFI